MKQEERIKAFTLRCEGKTWAQIGEILHYDEQTVSKDLHAVIKRLPKRRQGIRYPHLREYVQRQCGGSITVFAGQMGVSPYRLRRVLVHGDKASPKLCSKIQTATHLSGEQVFLEEKGIGEEHGE